MSKMTPYRIMLACFVAALLTQCHDRNSTAKRTEEAMKWADKEYVLCQEARFDSALICLDKADSIAGDNDTIRAYTCAERSTISVSTGELDKSVAYAKQSIAYATRIKDWETILNMHNNLGIVFRRMSMLDSALYYYKKGMECATKTDSKDYVANLLGNIALIYAQQGRIREAYAYADKAESYALAAKDTLEFYNTLGTKATILVKQGKLDEVTKLIEPHYDAIMNTQHPALISKAIRPLLQAYIHQGMTDKAEATFAKLKPLISVFGENSIVGMGLLESEAQLAKLHKDYDRELALLRHMNVLNKQSNNTPPQELLYHMAVCYRNMGDTGMALATMERAYLASDSLKNSDNNKQMSEFSVHYKTQDKELQLSMMKEEKARQQVLMLIMLVMLLLVCTALAGFFLRRRAVRQAYELKAHRRYIEGMEDERTRLARELHDGTCNDLLALSMMVSRGDSRSLDNVRQIRDNVRRVSHELMAPHFLATDIDNVLSEYVERYPLGTCDITYTSNDAKWDTVPEQVAYEIYRITQENMGNIVKHSHPTYIRVEMRLEHATLTLTIDNDGAAPCANATDGRGSFTLQERANSINGRTATRHEGDTFHFAITVPMDKRNKMITKNDP